MLRERTAGRLVRRSYLVDLFYEYAGADLLGEVTHLPEQRLCPFLLTRDNCQVAQPRKDLRVVELASEPARRKTRFFTVAAAIAKSPSCRLRSPRPRNATFRPSADCARSNASRACSKKSRAPANFSCLRRVRASSL